MISILKTDKVYEKSKLRLHLQDIGFQGFLCLMQGQTFNLEIIHSLTDIILSRGDTIAIFLSIKIILAMLFQDVKLIDSFILVFNAWN